MTRKAAEFIDLPPRRPFLWISPFLIRWRKRPAQWWWEAAPPPPPRPPRPAPSQPGWGTSWRRARPPSRRSTSQGSRICMSMPGMSSAITAPCTNVIHDHIYQGQILQRFKGDSCPCSYLLCQWMSLFMMKLPCLVEVDSYFQTSVCKSWLWDINFDQ